MNRKCRVSFAIFFKLIDENETISMEVRPIQNANQTLIDLRVFQLRRPFFPRFELDTANERSQFDFMANTWNYDRFTFSWF